MSNVEYHFFLEFADPILFVIFLESNLSFNSFYYLNLIYHITFHKNAGYRDLKTQNSFKPMLTHLRLLIHDNSET